ncbi:hypothetical protein BHE74_00050605 [Ensete ventricosum]|nr:hypothetical protein GW17_00036265 [Ensete ventricosum]RWW43703.1 hypothetical protein BHE74_00050605 [Ensete ventricosum]RZS04186.1 hypothetical protein BHM03_00034479 [Ensete ventricosum]
MMKAPGFYQKQTAENREGNVWAREGEEVGGCIYKGRRWDEGRSDGSAKEASAREGQKKDERWQQRWVNGVLPPLHRMGGAVGAVSVSKSKGMWCRDPIYPTTVTRSTGTAEKKMRRDERERARERDPHK